MITTRRYGTALPVGRLAFAVVLTLVLALVLSLNADMAAVAQTPTAEATTPLTPAAATPSPPPPSAPPDPAPPPPAPPDPVPAAEQALAAATTALAGAEATMVDAGAAVAAARAAVAAADASVRDAEVALVANLRAVDDAEQRAATLSAQVDEQRVALTDARERQSEAETALDNLAATTYKLGSASRSTLTFEVIRRAQSPSDLAVGLYQLGSLLDYEEGIIQAVRRTRGISEAAVADLSRARLAVSALVSSARAGLDADYAGIDALRQDGYTAEEGFIAAARGQVAATTARDRAAALVTTRSAELAAAKAARAAAAAATAGAAEGTVPPAPVTPPAPAADLAPAQPGSDGLDVSTAEPGATPPPPDAPDQASAQAAEEGTDPATPLEVRTRQIDARQKALDKQRSVDPGRRQVTTAVVCQTEGSSFANDWHFPRGSDRQHEGTDVFAPRDTPVVAPYDGIIKSIDRIDTYGTGGSDLGGRTVSMWVAEDEYWYFAHLETVPDELQIGQQVTAGTLLGSVGDSGNAAGTPTHVHTGRYVNAVAVNPFPTLAYSCRPLADAPAPEQPAADPAG